MGIVHGTLNWILDWHRRNGHSLDEILNPAIPKELVSNKLKDIGCDCEELSSIFEWRNGTRSNHNLTLGEVWIIPGYYLLPLESCIEIRNINLRVGHWNPQWLPFLFDECDGTYAYSCAPGQVGQILHEMEGTQEVIFPNLESALESWKLHFEKGAYEVKNGRLAFNRTILQSLETNE